MMSGTTGGLLDDAHHDARYHASSPLQPQPFPHQHQDRPSVRTLRLELLWQYSRTLMLLALFAISGGSLLIYAAFRMTTRLLS